MKKSLCTVLFIALVSFAHAQSQGDFRLNVGLAFGSEAGYDGGGLGFNLGGEYFVIDPVSVSPSYTYFFKSSVSDYSIRLSSFNIDGRYYFLTGDLQVYGIAGIAVLSVKSDVPSYTFGGVTYGGGSASSSDTGLNVGGGIVFPLTDKIGLNGQLKYQTPGQGQLVLNAGLAIGLN